MKSPHWTHAEEVSLVELYADWPNALLAQAYGRSMKALCLKARKLGLKKSAAQKAIAGRFQPGDVPPNKGVRRPGWAVGRMAETQFKKGQRSPTEKPLGSMTVNADGYLYRKVAEHGTQFERWKPVHRLVWMATNGPVPPGCMVRFRPGCKTTEEARITLDALELVTKAEHMAQNSVHRLPEELAQVVLLRGAVNRAINRRDKKA